MREFDKDLIATLLEDLLGDPLAAIAGARRWQLDGARLLSSIVRLVARIGASRKRGLLPHARFIEEGPADQVVNILALRMGEDLNIALNIILVECDGRAIVGANVKAIFTPNIGKVAVRSGQKDRNVFLVCVSTGKLDVARITSLRRRG